jgi:putative restriction enzyme
MAYRVQDALNDFNKYLGNFSSSDFEIIENTNSQGKILTLGDEKVVLFLSPLGYNSSANKRYFDARDSGVTQRLIAYNYAKKNNYKYFYLGIRSELYGTDYVFSLECPEDILQDSTGNVGMRRRAGKGNQINFSRTFVPSKSFERITTHQGIFISCIHKDFFKDYLLTYDNRQLIDMFSDDGEEENTEDDNVNLHQFDIDCVLREDLVQEIRFGAPGTGKSYSIKNIIRKSYPGYEENDSNPFVLRTTIHGEYSHFDFVGNVMPTSKNGVVGYEFTEGIFTTALIRAMLNKENDVYLIIEEMSRGDIASIFGDIFQLLDRNEEGISEYRIDNSLISDELVKNGAKSKGDDKIYLPSNLHIIGTVNTSDQNVNVLDTAFKRRFSFVYESVKPSYNTEDGKILNSAIFNLGGKEFEWNQFYLSVNQFIVSDLGLSEDKQLGQFFVKFNEGVDVNEIIKNKVLHYLWEDVQNASISDEASIFNNEIRAFSILYDKFDKDTTASEIFSDAFLKTYDDQKVELRKKQNE